jgi:hypothetical protein
MTDASFGSFFLADPSKFPSAVGGEEWGEVERRLDLPGGPFNVRGLSSSQADNLDASLSSATTADQNGDVPAHHTMVLRADAPLFRSFDIEGWEYTFDMETTPKFLRLAGLDFFAVVPWDESAVAGLWTSVEDRWFQGVIENYFRVLVAHRLLREKGVLLHSAGVVIDDQAFLFIGPSAAGKTTLARKALAAGFPVLSDDLNAILDASDDPMVVQLPFTGELERNANIPRPRRLGGIFLLEKDKTVSFVGISRGDAVASLVSTSPFVNQDEASFDTLLDTVDGLARKVPIAKMTSALDSTFDEITSGLRGFQ